MTEPQIIDIGNLDSGNSGIKLNLSSDDSTLKSSNFGPGIELLMNDKKKNNQPSENIDLGDLNTLENELNDLSDSIDNGVKPTMSVASWLCN